MKWNFDIGSQNYNETGENTFSTMLEEATAKFAKDNKGCNPEISMFAREVISNSADQKIQGNSQPVKIFIDVISIDGETKKEFKRSIDWDTLSKHIISAKNGRKTKTQKRLDAKFREFDDDTKQSFLVRVSDYNAKGLVGGETGSDEDKSQNFHLFCRSVFKSQITSARQGSYGLGKGVLYHCSGISTVIMSSTIKDGSENKLRVYGRSELPSHVCEDGTDFNPSNRWAGPGFFGDEISEDGMKRAISSFKESPQTLKQLFLDRDENLGTGTTAISIAYDPKETPVEALISDFKRETRRWFWPGLCRQNPQIQVIVRMIKNNEEPKEEIVNVNEFYEPFVKCFLNEEDSIDLAEDGNIVSKEKEWTIPRKIDLDKNGRKKILEEEFQGVGLIKVHRTGYKNEYLKNKIALLRNNLCVVAYRDIKLFGDNDCYFYGVFKGGEARGQSQTDIQFSNFLRDAEPPLHNHWLHTGKIETNYDLKTVHSFLQNLTNDIIEEASLIADSSSESNKNDYSHLARLFKFGKAGPGENKKSLSFKYYDQSDLIDNKFFKIKLKINNLKDDNKNWGAKVVFKIDKQKGASEYNFNLKNLAILNDNQDKAQKKIDNNTAFLRIDKNVSSIDISAEVHIPRIIKESLRKRLTYTVNVTPERSI
tara:strand:+ start:3565 stop:5517 length:1953 start_codon:yes stop_codon:yes gene_type:complete